MPPPLEMMRDELDAIGLNRSSLGGLRRISCRLEMELDSGLQVQPAPRVGLLLLHFTYLGTLA